MSTERSDAGRVPNFRRGSFEVLADDSFGFGGADAWRVLVTWDGLPCAYLQLADPGQTRNPHLTAASLVRAAEVGRRHERERTLLERRLGVREHAPRRPTCTVVMCTHRRPELATRAIAALVELDPAADEIIVVDNAPGDRDCRAAAEAAGVRYLLERRRGQDWARATGLAASSSELVAFVDDDVVVSRGWLRPLPELFTDPAVGAATGVAVGRTLLAPAQTLRESFAGFVPGMQPQQFDWTSLRALSSGRAGAGANMIFRRSLLLELGDVFPAELDGGTPTSSGGDLYALYRVLAAGRRIAFDPGLYAEHEHPSDPDAIHHTMFSYGLGFSAMLTKALVEDRELGALGAWWWSVGRFVDAVLLDAVHPGTGHVDLRRDFLRGALRGARAWTRSRHQQRARARPAAARTQGAGTMDADERVFVITAGSPDERNLAARHASAEVLLFLPAGMRPSPDLARKHIARHDAGAEIVVGYTGPNASTSGLAAQLAALERFDRARARSAAAALTFDDVTADNLSIERDLFEDLGGFDEALGPEAAARELGIRALASGIRLDYEPDASAVQAIDLTTRAAIARLRRAGRDDARIATSHPEVVGALPFGGVLRSRWAGRAMAMPAQGPMLALGLALADLLEGARLRGLWLHVYSVLSRAAYLAGYESERPPLVPRRSLVVDLTATEPISAPAVAAPEVELRIGRRPVATLRAPGGQWGRRLAEDAVRRLRHRDIEDLLCRREPWVLPPDMPSLEGVLVVFGPRHRPGDDAHVAELVAAGARIERLAGHADEHWHLVADCVASAPEQLIALPLPGVRAAADCLRTALVPFAGDRVAAVFGPGIPRGVAPRPTFLVSRDVLPGIHRTVGEPAQYVVVSAAHVAGIGGIDPTASHFTDQGPVLDLLERVLNAGFVIAYQETPGVSPPGTRRPERARSKWERARARGGLLTRLAVRRGGVRGAAFLTAHLLFPTAVYLRSAVRTGAPGPRHLLGTAAGMVAGSIKALATVRSWRHEAVIESPRTEPRRSLVVAEPDI